MPIFSFLKTSDLCYKICRHDNVNFSAKSLRHSTLVSAVPVPSFTVTYLKFCCLSYFRQVITVTKMRKRVAVQGSVLSASCVISVNILVFHCEGLLASLLYFRPKEHPSSSVYDPVFSTLTAPFLTRSPSSPSTTPGPS